MSRVAKSESNALKLFKYYVNHYTMETTQELAKVSEWIDADDYEEEMKKAKFLLDSVSEAMNFESFIPKAVVDLIRTGKYFRIGKNEDGEYVVIQNREEHLLGESKVKDEPEFRASMSYYDFLSQKGTDIRFFNYAGYKFVLTLYGFDQLKGNIVSLNYKNNKADINLNIFCQFGDDNTIVMTYKLDGKIVLQKKYELSVKDRYMIYDSSENNKNSI